VTTPHDESSSGPQEKETEFWFSANPADGAEGLVYRRDGAARKKKSILQLKGDSVRSCGGKGSGQWTGGLHKATGRSQKTSRDDENRPKSTVTKYLYEKALDGKPRSVR